MKQRSLLALSDYYSQEQAHFFMPKEDGLNDATVGYYGETEVHNASRLAEMLPEDLTARDRSGYDPMPAI